MGGRTLRVRGNAVQVLFFRADSGRFRGRSYLVGAFGGVQVCSDLFRFVQGRSGVTPRREWSCLGRGAVSAWGGGH